MGARRLGTYALPFVAIFAVLWKLRLLITSRILFDGASLILLSTVTSLSTYQLYPALMTLNNIPLPQVKPLQDALSGVLPAQHTKVPLDILSHETALTRSIAASHAIIATALCGIVVLQCGEYYAERAMEREDHEDRIQSLAKKARRSSQTATPKRNSKNSSSTVISSTSFRKEPLGNGPVIYVTPTAPDSNASGTPTKRASRAKKSR